MADLNDVMHELGQLQAQARALKIDVGGVREDVKELRRVLKGTNDSPGLCVRVDRQEQQHKRHLYFLIPAMGALAALVVHRVWAVAMGR